MFGVREVNVTGNPATQTLYKKKKITRKNNVELR